MNLTILLIMFGTVIAQSISEAMFPILYDCCTEVAHHIPRRWLRRNVLMFEIQKGGDLCKIPAVILYTRHKKLCASPQNRNVKKWMKQKVESHEKMGHQTRKKNKGKKRRKNMKEH
ncbi:C-C motif chemokine 28 [Varanus komodoensis]|uniref:C-C motif chemokine 28 n=1 Tax=Varanus komodoensis TaxID=61221 RepID=UPI001CF78C9B|nr:C-C motif chemokine 28 [Varanus komodoensis]